MSAKQNSIAANLGIAVVLAGIIAALLFSGLTDFTTPALDWVHDQIIQWTNFKSIRPLNNSGFWTGFYLQLVIGSWLFSANWWIVLIGAAVLIIASILAINLLISPDFIEDIQDSADTRVSCQWVRFYYAIAGLFLSTNMEYDMALINSAVLLAPLVVIYLFQWNGFSGILPALVLWITGVFIGVVFSCIAWIAVIAMIFAFFKLISSGFRSGTASEIEPVIYINGEPAQRVGDIYYTVSGRFRRGPTGIDFERLPD